MNTVTVSSGCDEKNKMFMKVALEEAKIAHETGEVPVGCVFVDKHDNIIARGHNRTNETRNGTQHAEIVAINEVILKQGKSAKEFEDATLYVSCEPCIMCAAAIAKLKIKAVYFGCHNDRFGGNGSILSIHNNQAINCYHLYEVHAGLGADEAINIFQKFYDSENRRAPEAKRRRKV